MEQVLLLPGLYKRGSQR